MSEGNGHGGELAVRSASTSIRQGVLRPQSMDELYRLARGVFRSGLVPKGAKTEEQVFIAMAAGLEIGLSPMQAVANVMVVNGKAAVYGDAALALVQGGGELEDITEGITPDKPELAETSVATCTVKRKGRATPTVRTFSVADAKKAGLWGKQGPWTQYPKRMLQLRARAFALRDAFPDVLLGIGIAEEVQDYPDPEAAQTKATGVQARIAALPAAPGFGGDAVTPPPMQESTPERQAKTIEPPASDPEDAAAFLASMERQ